MKLAFSLTALFISKTFLLFQSNRFSTAEITSEVKIVNLPNVEFATYFIGEREYFHQNVLSRSLKNAPGSDRYVLV